MEHDLRLGYHVSKGKYGFKRSIETAIEKDDVNVFQLFVAGPRNSRMLDVSDLYDQTRHSIYVHASYTTIPWSCKSNQIKLVRDQMLECIKINAKGLIVHLPKGNPETVLLGINAIFDNWDVNIGKCKLILEILSCKKGQYTSYETPEKLVQLYKVLMSSPYFPYIGFCIDTAHLYSIGMALSSKKDTDGWILDLISVFGKDVIPTRFPLIHLNDSGSVFESGKDIHENYSKGKLWSKYKNKMHESGLLSLIRFAKRFSIALMLETPESDYKNDLKVIRQLNRYEF